MIYVGIDPSTTGAHYAMIDVDGQRSRVYAGKGELKDVKAIHGFVAILKPDTVVAIERPAGLHIHDEGIAAARARAEDLMATSWMGAQVAGMARYRGLRVVEVSPERARSTIVGSAHPHNSQIKVAVEALVHLWPKVSNEHVRDAAVVALAASQLGRMPSVMEEFQ